MATTDCRGHRVALSCPVYFIAEKHPGGRGKATLLDVSAGGCRVSSSVVGVHQDMVLRLSLFLPDHLPWPLVVEEARVRWVKGQEFGVEFMTLLLEGERLRALLQETERPSLCGGM